MKRMIPVLVALCGLCVVLLTAGQYSVVRSPLTGATNACFDLAAYAGTSSNSCLASNLDVSARGFTNYTYAQYFARPRLVPVSTCGVTVFGHVDGTEVTNTVTLQKSYDGTNNWETLLIFDNATSVATAGDLWVASTNVVLGDYGYVRVSDITNTCATPITNLGVFYYHK